MKPKNIFEDIKKNTKLLFCTFCARFTVCSTEQYERGDSFPEDACRERRKEGELWLEGDLYVCELS